METLAALMAQQPSLLGSMNPNRNEDVPPEITKEHSDLLHHLNFGEMGDEEGERAEDDELLDEDRPVLSAANESASTSPVDSATPTDTPKEGSTPCATPVNGGPAPTRTKEMNIERKILELKAKADAAAAAAASVKEEEKEDDGPILNTGLENQPSAAAMAALTFDPSKFDLSALGMQGVGDDLKPLLASGLAALMRQTMAAAEKKPTPTLPSMPTDLSMNGISAAPPTVATPPAPTTPKRKRQRRNPVWPYFDVVDGTARCKQCPYSTKSVFSTNLKVHLRSHHRADYEKVIEAEDALNLNALLLSNGAGALDGSAAGRKRSLPPMTNSFLMTINKLAKQNPDDSALNSVLRQTLMKQNQQQQAHNQQLPNPQQGVNSALPAALQAAAAQLARSQLAQMAAGNSQSSPLMSPQVPPMSADSFFKQFTFPTAGAAARSASAAMQRPNSGSPQTTWCVDQRPQQKRRRLRRHPVWMFYRDLEDRMVGCINCDFKTGSAFSTNLKMHLKAHHKDDYAKVLKLEDEMRIEEGRLAANAHFLSAGVFGPPNKIKSELIDFIRGGGNASTATSTAASPTAPQPSPLVRNFIQQTSVGRQQQAMQAANNGQTVVPSVVRKAATIDGMDTTSFDEDAFMSMSTQDRLAALVGLVPNATDQEENENTDETTAEHEDGGHMDLLERLGLTQPAHSQQKALEELRKAAERIAAANGSPSVDLATTSNGSEAKTSSASSMDGDSSSKLQVDRDRALAKFWLDQGGNEQLLHSETFKVEEEEEEPLVEESNIVASTEEPTVPPLPPLTLTEDQDLIQRALLDTMSLLSGSTVIPSASSSTSDAELASTNSILQLFAEFEKSTKAAEQEKKYGNPDYKPRKGSILNLDEKELTPVELARKVAAERMRQRRANETPEEREIRLQRMRARYRARVANETEAEKEARRRARRANSADGSGSQASSSGTPEPAMISVPLAEESGSLNLGLDLSREASAELTADSPSESLSGGGKLSKKHSLESDEERFQRLERMREYQRRRLEKETPEQRERRLEKMRQNQRQRRERKSLEAQQAQLVSAALNALPQDFIHTLAPDYRIPDSASLAAMAEEEGDLSLP